MTQHRLCSRSDLAPGEMRSFEVQGRAILLARVGNEFFALRDACVHQGARLSGGRLTGTMLPDDVGMFCYGRKGEIVRCPWHGFEFDVRTGRSLHEPKKTRVRAYRIMVDGDDVILELTSRRGTVPAAEPA